MSDCTLYLILWNNEAYVIQYLSKYNFYQIEIILRRLFDNFRADMQVYTSVRMRVTHADWYICKQQYQYDYIN